MFSRKTLKQKSFHSCPVLKAVEKTVHQDVSRQLKE